MHYKQNIQYLVYFIFALFGLLFLPFWKTLIIAGIFAFALQPLLPLAKGKIVSHRMVILAVVATTLAIITPVILGVVSLSSQIVSYSKGADPLIKSNNISSELSQKLTTLYKGMGLKDTKMLSTMTEKVSSSVGETVLKTSSEFVSNIPSLILSLIIFILSLYMFLSYQTYIKNQILKWQLLSTKDLDELITVLKGSCSNCLLSLVTVGAAQAAIILIGAAITDFPALMLIFLITFTCSFIPIIGAAPIGFVLGLWRLMNGEVGQGLFLFLIACFAGIIDNILKPILVKRTVNLDGVLTLISIIGAIIVFDLPGLFIGPVVATTAAHYFYKGKD